MRNLLFVLVSTFVGFWVGYFITRVRMHNTSRWLDNPERERNRQRAERMAIRRDMDLHPAEKGELW